MNARLSTCARCGGTIDRSPGSLSGWAHVKRPTTPASHLPEPDDGAVSYDGPRCEGEDCGAPVDDWTPFCDDCAATITCPTCHGNGGWQQSDGLIVECPRGCMTEERAA